jgi:hypothetical protein
VGDDDDDDGEVGLRGIIIKDENRLMTLSVFFFVGEGLIGVCIRYYLERQLHQPRLYVCIDLTLWDCCVLDGHL